jgi:hypothetical protein
MPPAAAAIAEQPTRDKRAPEAFLRQEYAHSMETICQLGAVVTAQQVEVTEVGVEQLARDDFNTSVIEMLKTDPDFKEKLQVESIHSYQIIDGQVCNTKGEPIAEAVKKGWTASLHKAQSDQRMAIQAGRDEADYHNALAVDDMPVGTTRHALSMEPKQELKADPQFWRRFGYREGVAYLQSYSKVSDSVLVTSVLTIDLSDTDAWRQIFAEEDVVVPKGESPNNWLKYALQKQQTPQESLAYVKRLRQRYYQLVGSTTQRYSVSEFVAKNQATVDTIFSSYYPHVAEALYKRTNNPIIQQFAADLLLAADDLKPEVRQGLIKLVNKSKFDDADGRLMDSVLRYTAVEELRKNLPAFLGQAAAVDRQPILFANVAPLQIPPAQLNRLLAVNLRSGVRAGRTYGGCAQQINLGRDKKPGSLDDNDPLNLQDEFGGRGDQDEAEEGEESTGVACEYVHDGCYCCAYGADGRRLPTRLKVRARRDKYGTAHCLRTGCNAYLDKNGNGDVGDIYRKAQALQNAKNQPVANLNQKRKQKQPQMAYNKIQEEEALVA